MINEKRVLAIVPARGGSKGVKLKNLRPVNGKPLVTLAGECLKQIPEIDRRVVSTDHEEIIRVAEKSGLDGPFKRPPELSGDRISDWEVLHHGLLTMEDIDNIKYEIIMMIQPTSPLRTPKHVRDTLKYFIKGNWDAVWTVSKTDLTYHPLKQLTIQNGNLEYFDPLGSKIIARQQLTPVYHCNGIAYAFSRECILDQKTKKGLKTGAMIIDSPAISIDTLDDFKFVEDQISKKLMDFKN